jgi:hypothetical protein
MSLSFSMFFLDFFFHQTSSTLDFKTWRYAPNIFFSVWSFATQPENQLKKRGIQKMMQIDFEDVHDVTGWIVRDSSVVRLHYISLLEPSNVRAQYIRKTADLPHQLWVGTFPRFVAIGFYLKISFYHNVFFGLAWWRDEYNVLSKNVTRDVSQSEKTLSEVI